MNLTNVGISSTVAGADVYSVPPGLTAAILMIHIANTAATEAYFDISWYDAATTNYTFLAKNMHIFGNSAISILDRKIISEKW